jgi:hypothetical protein
MDCFDDKEILSNKRKIKNSSILSDRNAQTSANFEIFNLKIKKLKGNSKLVLFFDIF